MVLFNTIEQVKSYLSGIEISSEFSSIESDFLDAQEAIIKQTLGKELYDMLLEDYEEHNGDADTMHYKDLLPHVQKALAPLGYLYHLPISMVKFGERGMYITQTETDRIPYEWTTNKIENYLIDIGMNRIELLLEFLEENQTDFDEWVDSTAYTVWKESFNNTAKDFSKQHNIDNSRRLYVALKSIIRQVDNNNIKPAISEALYDELMQQIKNNNISADNQLLMPMLQLAEAKLTIAKACIFLSLKLTDKGLVLKVTSPMQVASVDQQADKDMLQQVLNESRSEGEAELKKLRDYLNANASATKYAAYYSSSAYVAPGTATGYENNSTKGLVVF